MWPKEDKLLASAESVVSNNSTLGNIPRETAQLSSYPTEPQPPAISSQFWHIHTSVM